ncbi:MULTISPECIES: ABC transporter permease [unclassified Carboxylicivirga]|uniref:ABC transporter permease n=1 Tax=Carboxylicivirga TaxID=1628153 RepID=UPI003D3344E5
MMLTHHIKVAIRSIRKQGIYALLNVFGLSLGLVLGLFVILLVRHELSYDTVFTNSDRICRLATKGVMGNDIINSANTPMPLAGLLSDSDEVGAVVRIVPGANNVVEADDKRFNEDGFIFGDEDFFDLFDLPFSQKADSFDLSVPSQVVLTSSTANKYFGKDNAVGQFIERDGMTYKVVGVCQDLPSASHLRFDFVASLSTIDQILLNKTDSSYLKTWKTDWLYLNCYTYLRLREGVDAASFVDWVNAAKDELLLPQVATLMKTQQDAGKGVFTFFAQKIQTIHFESHLDGEFTSNSKPIYIRLFVFVAIFVLLTTCINFMNLTTAKMRDKYQEVGYRQLVGATRSQLILQFLIEALVYGLGAMFISMVLLELLLPFLNSFFEVRLTFNFFRGWIDFFGILVVLLVVGLLAGSFPAFFFSGLKPEKLIAGVLKIGRTSFIVRGLFVTSQFAVVMFLAVVASAMWWQIDFVQNNDPGFDTSNILVVERGHAIRSELPAFKADLKALEGVRYVSVCNSLPGDDHYQYAFRLSGGSDDQVVFLPINFIDDDYFRVMGLGLKAGRFLNLDLGDSLAVNLNEAAVAKLGMRKPLDEKIETLGDKGWSLTTVGVIRDYHYESYFSPINPLALILIGEKSRFEYVLIKMVDDVEVDVKAIRAVWDKYSGGAPFVYNTLEDRIEKLYDEDVRIAKIMSVFTFLSFFVALLGLIALVTFIIEYKAETVALKNVLGAPRQSIMRQVFSMFGAYVAGGVLLAFAPAYYAIKAWGSSYAYFDFIGWWIFVAWAIALIFMAFLVTFTQAYRGVRLRLRGAA